MIVAVIAMCAGCGPSSRVLARVQHHVYARQCAQLAPAARQLLEDQGYRFVASGASDGSVSETAWRDDPFVKNAGPTASRYLVRFEGDAARCRVELTRFSSTRFGLTDQRDLETELELLRRVEPSDARTIENETATDGDSTHAGSRTGG